MKKVLILYLICFLGMALTSAAQVGKPKVLIFNKTLRYRHASIPAGLAAIQQLGKEHGFSVDTTTNAALFLEDSLRKYATVIFLSTTGDVLNRAQEMAFERYIQAGGGYVGIHSASSTEYDWAWYGQLAGAYFDGHPPDPVEGVVEVVDAKNPATKHLPKRWKRIDEWYNFKKRVEGLHVLLAADESTYEGGTNGVYHPLAWYHELDGGRAFYTALGHTDEAFADPLYLQHILGGIQYAIGKNKPLNYAKAKRPKNP